jgi:predicted DNA-binding protein with PD1-like motif
METGTIQVDELIIVRGDMGEDLLEVIKWAIRQENIVEGAIISGVGSLNVYSSYLVSSRGTTYPVTTTTVSREGPLELAAIQGTIAQGQPHIHLVVADKDSAYAGHLVEGCQIYTLAEIVIAKFRGGQLVRDPNPGKGPRLLRVKNARGAANRPT